MNRPLLKIIFLGFLSLIIPVVANSYELFSIIENSSLSSNNCLEKFHGKPDELLTAELVGNFVDFENAEVDVAKVSSQIIRDEDFAQVNCKWKIDKKRHIVRLSKISKIKLHDKTPVDQFYFQYHTLSEKEKKELKRIYDEEVQKKTNNDSANEISKSIGFDFEYLKVDGLGDAAVWEYKANDLIVLVGEYKFTININLNKGNGVNLERAKLIAEAIIEKACK